MNDHADATSLERVVERNTLAPAGRYGHAVFARLALFFCDRNGEKVSSLSQKYRLEIYDEDRNTITLSLRIFSIERHDYGTYTCVASNTLGEDSESMVLYGESVILCGESVP